MKKLLAIMLALSVLAVGTVSLKAQNVPYYISYDQTIYNIKLFDSAKVYSPEATGDLMDLILYGMTHYSGSYMSEGLKYRLSSVSQSKLYKELNGVSNIEDAGILILMCESKVKVQPKITDKNLRNIVGKNGLDVKKSIQKIWGNSDLNEAIECLEAYDPWTAAAFINMACKPIYSVSEKKYEYTQTTWASQSLWNIKYDLTMVEIAKRSVVMKLLIAHGYFHIQPVTCAEFRYSGWPSIAIPLDPITWNEGDIQDLIRLLNNDCYKVWARAQLKAMHVPGY